MIQNKKLAIILSILTFAVGSVIFTVIIFYALGYPISSVWAHQNYFFLGILAAAVLASFVYGRGSAEKASKAAQIVEESFGIQVKSNVMWKIMRAVGQMHPAVVNKYISLQINAADEFREEIEKYKSNISPEDLLKIRKIIDTPIPELQEVLKKLYVETDMEQFKILADPEAESLIELNLHELQKIFFGE